jgi:hypothetical protein
MLRFRVLIILILTFVGVSFVLAQATPNITTFTSDVKNITPHEAESGAAFVNLAWATDGIRPDDTVHLQVYVLGQWHDVMPGALTSTGTLKWAVPHTLDFIPPTFRLVVRDRDNQPVTYSDLVIPYAEVNPLLPPEISTFSTTFTSLTDTQLLNPDFALPVTWEVKGRPPRANLVFEQVMDTGRVVLAELPRAFRWIRSKGEGALRPLLDGNSLLLRARLFDIDTGEVYDEKTLAIPVISLPENADSIVPEINAFATNYTPKRGDTVKVSWQAKDAAEVRIEAYDIDYFPRWYAPVKTLLRLDNLPLSGSQDITFPADYTGSGWMVHVIAIDEDRNSSDVHRLDFVFADVKQMVLLNVKTFAISPQPVKRGEKVTIIWETTITTRTSENGVQNFNKPISGYDDKLYLEITGVSPMAATPDSPFNQRFANLNKSGSFEVTIGDYDSLYHGFVVVLGMDVDSTPITYDNLFVELVPPPNLTTTQVVEAAYQPFTGGFMIWNAQNGEVRVYYGATSGEVEVFPQSTYESLPDNPVEEGAPTGFFKPVNAFGRIWGNREYVRNLLGWAASPEQGYSMSIVTHNDPPNVTTITLPNDVKIHQVGGKWNY